MRRKSFANLLSWTILGVVSAIFILSQLVVAMVSNIIIAKEVHKTKVMPDYPIKFLLQSPEMHIALVVIELVSFIMLFLVCRRIIRTKTRPITDELQTTTIANERMESELNLARNIQMGMLSTNFPPQLYALMNPAKEVGGDLYDFTLKDDSLYFAIGDVSGKGMPASLMMAITKATLHIVEGLNLPLDKTLRRINDSVSEANSREMFVTLFVARINLKTGHMEYCNAGHNPILIMPPNSEPYFLKAKPNLAIGLFKDFDYEAESLDLKVGTRIIAYTDGVTEAEKEDQTQYGNDRLMDWAKHIVETSPETSPETNSQEKTIVESLYASVNAFTEDNSQNDDITIMSLKIERLPRMTKKRFNPITDKSIEIIDFLMASPDMPKDEALRFKLQLSIEEAVENVVRYAYEGGIGWLEVGTSLDHDSLMLTVELRDAGVPFNPLEAPNPDVTLPANEREIGGLGIYICKKMMDTISYQYEDGNNVLTMTKRVNG